MADIFVEVESMDSGSRVCRPSLVQVKAVIDFMQKHPDLAHRKLRYGVSHQKFKKLWIELSNIANSIDVDGAVKSTKGWIKFWSDKRRSVMMKQKQIEQGKIQGKLSPLEQKILDLCESCKTVSTKKKKSVKQEPCNGDDNDDNDSLDDILSKDDEELEDLFDSETAEKQLNIMEKLVDVMGHQATAMSQMAQAQLDNSKAMERLAEASHIQALAVDRLAGSFDTISSSVHDIRNALLGIDYTMKRCFPGTTSQRQNSNIFS